MKNDLLFISIKTKIDHVLQNVLIQVLNDLSKWPFLCHLVI